MLPAGAIDTTFVSHLQRRSCRPRTNKTAAPVEPALLQSIDPVWLLYCEGANVMKNILRNDEPPQDLVLDAKVARSELRGRVTRFPR